MNANVYSNDHPLSAPLAGKASSRRLALAGGIFYLLTFVSIPTAVLYEAVRDPNFIAGPGPDNGIWFEGDKGRIFVNRSRITGEPVESLTESEKEAFDEPITKLYKGRPRTGHMQNFFDCVRDRAEPVSDVFSHHRELTSCHLCNLAMLLKRKLRWDPQKEDFIGDKQASALISRPQRAPYAIKL